MFNNSHSAIVASDIACSLFIALIWTLSYWGNTTTSSRKCNKTRGRLAKQQKKSIHFLLQYIKL